MTIYRGMKMDTVRFRGGIMTIQRHEDGYSKI